MIVSIIGIDGCGKTTQARMLANRLEEMGYNCIYITTTYVIINLIVSPKIKNFSPRTISIDNNRRCSIKKMTKKLVMRLLGYPYALITYLLIKFIGRNKIVICDRWFYQFFFDLYGDKSKYLIDIFPMPDITFFLDGDLDTLYLRMDNLDKYVSKNYYTGIIDLCRKLSKKYSFCRIDAHADKMTINNLIFNKLTYKYLNKFAEK